MASVAQEPGYPLAPGPAKSFDHDTLEQRIRDALALSIAQVQPASATGPPSPSRGAVRRACTPSEKTRWLLSLPTQGQGVTTRDALERLSLSVLLQDVPAAPVTATRRRALLKVSLLFNKRNVASGPSYDPHTGPR